MPQSAILFLILQNKSNVDVNSNNCKLLPLYTVNMSGLYIHIPFCKKRCLYCDFYTTGLVSSLGNRYVDALKEELKKRKNEIFSPVSTLYIGGGTPSLLEAEKINEIVAAVRDTFGPDMLIIEEATIEVNPEDVTEEKAASWKKAGLNRVSIGIQSFIDEELEAIGRRHNAMTAINAYSTLRKYFSNISIDLIFGLPGQTVETWNRSIDIALGLHPQHISAYSLMYEERTAITALRDSNRLQEAPETDSESMFMALTTRLRDSGYNHYEISNYALPGFESVHNSSYWKQNPYLGLGSGAHSYDGDRVRIANPADIKRYISHFLYRQTENFCQKETLSDIELEEETILTRMRCREGLDLDIYGRRFGADAVSRIKRHGARWINEGKLILNDKWLSFSEKGLLISDSIIVDLLP